jgi:hypothetical protein
LEVVTIIIRNNPVVSILSGIVSAAQLAKATELSPSTCFKVLHDLTGTFNYGTIEIIHGWVVKNLGPCNETELFHPENNTDKGRRPLSGSPTPRQAEMTICGSCNMETLLGGDNCNVCEEPLRTLVSA